MKILVLGGTGAIGVDLVQILAEFGHDVVVTSRSPRRTEYKNIRYLCGDAHNLQFLDTLLNKKYDVIVDFMVYSTENFRQRYNIFLKATEQYVFLSSARIYADSEKLISEDSPRLLDVTKDSEYLNTDEYALAKARQEDFLFCSSRKNWTIIRPYITYSNQRLQLGIYEKELWLWRAIHGMTILFPRDIAERYTTMTFGRDVARGISRLIGNKEAFGKAFHVTCGKEIKWDDVLRIYKKVFLKTTGREIRIHYIDNSELIFERIGNEYQIIYDRLYDRKFDIRNFARITGVCDFTPPEEGLEKCLQEFLKRPEFKSFLCVANASMDKLTGERTKLSQISGTKCKMKYLLQRYFI